jgi:hypothetical protein
VDSPSTDGSDFELWSPATALRHGQCLLGVDKKVTRRKQASKCYVSSENKRRVQETVCACSDEDYECDVGYSNPNSHEDFMTKVDLQCVAKSDSTVPSGPPADCRGTYRQSKGYRKIPGDRCSGTTKLDATVVDCPASSAHRDTECPATTPCTKEKPWYSPNSKKCHHAQHSLTYLSCPPQASSPAANAPTASKFDQMSSIDSPIAQFQWMEEHTGGKKVRLALGCSPAAPG